LFFSFHDFQSRSHPSHGFLINIDGCIGLLAQGAHKYPPPREDIHKYIILQISPSISSLHLCSKALHTVFPQQNLTHILFQSQVIFFLNTSFFLKMPPRRDPLRVDSDYNTSNHVQVLTSVLNELLRMQQQNNPDPLWLDTLIQLPKFSWKNNGEVLDSWICRISQYFNTCRGLTEERKLQIIALHINFYPVSLFFLSFFSDFSSFASTI
jgi:hypothetical protein